MNSLMTQGGDQLEEATMRHLDLIICSALVWIYAINRFNTIQDDEFPPPSRSTTTASRYFLAQAAYVLVSIAILLGLTLSPNLLQLAQIDSTTLPDQVQNLPAIYVAALFLTIFLPNVPYLGQLDGTIRRWLYNTASIPTEARFLKAKLTKAKFQVPPDRIREVGRQLGALAVPALAQSIEDNDCRSCLTKIAAVLEGMEQGEGREGLAVFIARYPAQFVALSARYKDLVGATGPVADWLFAAEPTNNAARCYLNDIRQRANLLFVDLCRFVSRAALFTQTTEHRRMTLLRELGFRLEEAQAPDATKIMNLACQVFLLASAALLVVLVGLSATESDDPDFLAIVLKAVMIGCIYGSAVVWALALAPRLHANDARAGAAGPAKGRSWSRYVVIVAVAVGVDLLIRYGFKYLLAVHVQATEWGPHREAWQELMDKLPWSLITATVAGACAFMVDSRVPRDQHARRRWIEGVGLAGINLVAGIIIWILLQKPPRLYALLPTVAAIGFAIGFSIPATYRQIRDRREGGADADAALAPLAH